MGLPPRSSPQGAFEMKTICRCFTTGSRSLTRPSIRTGPLLKHVGQEAEEELSLKLHADVNLLSAAHLATHLPQCAGFAGCAMGKTAKSRSQRRPRPRMTVQILDAEERPFGAMVYMGYVDMERGSEVAQRAIS